MMLIKTSTVSYFGLSVAIVAGLTPDSVSWSTARVRQPVLRSSRTGKRLQSVVVSTSSLLRGRGQEQNDNDASSTVMSMRSSSNSVGPMASKTAALLSALAERRALSVVESTVDGTIRRVSGPDAGKTPMKGKPENWQLINGSEEEYPRRRTNHWKNGPCNFLANGILSGPDREAHSSRSHSNVAAMCKHSRSRGRRKSSMSHGSVDTSNRNESLKSPSS